MRVAVLAAAALALASMPRATSAADMAAAQALMGWLQANGADVAKVGITDLPGMGLSMLATAPVPPSEPACMIPLNLTMSYATALDEPVIGPVVRALYDGTLLRLMEEAGDDGDAWIIRANLDRDTERIYGALLLLHYEAFINTARSRWGPYIASLPHGFPSLPRYYASVADAAADEMVRATPWLNELAAAKYTQATGMAHFMVSIMRRFPAVFGDLGGDEALRGRRLREARWCYDVSETRAFGARFAGDVHALYPLLDISNHDARYPSALPVLRPPPAQQQQPAAAGGDGGGSSSSSSAGGRSLAEQFVGVSIINGEKRPLAEGEQVWSSYHPRGTDGACNARLLSQYGFVDGNEASDCVRLLLSFPAIDTWGTKPDELTRRALLGALGIIAPPAALPNGTRPAGSPTVFDAHTLNTVAVRGEAIPPVLLRTLRVNNVPAQLLSRALTEGWTATGMLTLETELAAYQQLLGMLAAVRSEYEGVLEAWRGKGYVVAIAAATDGAGKEAVQPAPGSGQAVSNVLHVHLGAMRALDALRDQLVAQWNAFITQQLAPPAAAPAAGPA